MHFHTVPHCSIPCEMLPVKAWRSSCWAKLLSTILLLFYCYTTTREVEFKIFSNVNMSVAVNECISIRFHIVPQYLARGSLFGLGGVLAGLVLQGGGLLLHGAVLQGRLHLLRVLEEVLGLNVSVLPAEG